MDESIKLISHKPLEDYVTVLAIYNDPPLSSSSSVLKRPIVDHRWLISTAGAPSQGHTMVSPGRLVPAVEPLSRHLRDNSTADTKMNAETDSVAGNGDVVEVTTLDEPPTCGLEVAMDERFNGSGTKPKPSASSFNLRSNVKPSGSEQTRSVSVDRVSPPPAALIRNQARKSRLNDAFWNAKERLDQRLEDGANISSAGGGSASSFRHSKIVFSPETVNKFIGVEVSAVLDPDCPTKNLAVEVIRIENGGRIDLDGRIKVGDQITEINGRPASEMSLAKARRCLHDLEVIVEPSLAFNRRAQRRTSDANGQRVEIRPIRSALQQANTSKIGDTTTVVIKKLDSGFGFGFAGRVNAAGEHLYYVTTLRPNGASCGLLKIGDRLLKIDELDLAGVLQANVTKFLKSKNVGDSITIITSRMTDEPQPPVPAMADLSIGSILLGNASEPNASSSSQFNASLRSKASQRSLKKSETTTELSRAELSDMAAQVADDGYELVELDVALKDSPSAGIGLSLKAQKIYIDNETVDSGLYVRKLLYGSAAFRDGRLRVNDRLVAIENVNLLKFELNAEALDAFTSRLAQMSSSTRSVRIIVARQAPNTPRKPDDVRRAEFVVKQDGISSSLVVDESSGIEESESETSTAPDEEAFVRDTVTRKSISEKRPLGAHNDPSHLQTYQRIKHFRQTSAPVLCTDANETRKMSASDEPDTAAGVLCANRRRSVGAAHLSDAKRRLSFAPGAQAAADKFVADCRPLTIYDDGTSDFDESALSRVGYELKTLPLKLKNFESLKKSSRFFDFFKLNHSAGKKSPRDASPPTANGRDPALNNDDDTKENREKDASPGRRSFSFDQMGIEFAGARSRGSRLATSLDQTKSRKHVTAPNCADAETVVGATKMASSVSQPMLRTTTAETEHTVEKRQKENGIYSAAIAAEKRNRRKSTGSALLKLFQKSAPNSMSQLHAEDEKAAAKYTMLLEDRKKLDAMDETFRREYGLISRHVPTSYSSLPKEERRAPPPAYHQFIQYPLPPPPPSAFASLMHRRGHSTHEWSHEPIFGQNCNHLAGSSNSSNNNNRSNFVNRSHNYDNVVHGYDNTSPTVAEYSNVVGEPSSCVTIDRWKAARSPTGSDERNLSNQYCNMNSIDTSTSADRRRTADSGCSRSFTHPTTNHFTICRRHHRYTLSRHQQRPVTVDLSAAIPHITAPGPDGDTPDQRPTVPLDYDAIVGRTRSTHGSPTASPSQLYRNLSKRDEWGGRKHWNAVSPESILHRIDRAGPKDPRFGLTAIDSYLSPTNRPRQQADREDRRPNFQPEPTHQSSTRLLMNDEAEEGLHINGDSSTKVRWAADLSSPSRYWTDSNRINFYDDDVILAYSTPDNVTNISLGSPIHSLSSPNTNLRLGNVSFNSATQFRPNATVFPRSNSQSLNYRTKLPKWNETEHSRQQSHQTLPHAYCTAGSQKSSLIVYQESSHRRRTKMRRTVPSAVFYDDFDRL